MVFRSFLNIIGQLQVAYNNNSSKTQGFYREHIDAFLLSKHHCWGPLKTCLAKIVVQLLTCNDLLEDCCQKCKLGLPACPYVPPSIDLVYLPFGPIVLIRGFSGCAFFYIWKVCYLVKIFSIQYLWHKSI